MIEKVPDATPYEVHDFRGYAPWRKLVPKVAWLLKKRRAADPRTFRLAVPEGDPEWRVESGGRMPPEVADEVREKPGAGYAARRA